jgi:ribosomal-protein-alanine N-acetyltransferase
MPVTKGRYSFRILEPSDAPLLARLHAVSFAGQEVWDAKAMSDLMAMPGAFGFIGLQAAEPSGFVIARMAGEDSEIISLGVCPSDRRSGLARDLLRVLAAQVATLGGTRTFLEVAETNVVARALYAAEGYREIGRRPGYYRDEKDGDVAALVMAHSIGSANS